MNPLLHLYRNSLRFDDCIEAWGAPVMLLAMRLYVGWQFFKAGMVKLKDWEATVALFQDEYMVPLLSPEMAAVAGTAGELVLPSLLALGLLTRPAALGLLVMNVMAVVSYPALFAYECPAALNDHVFWGVMLLVLCVYGGGRLSVDAAARKLS